MGKFPHAKAGVTGVVLAVGVLAPAQARPQPVPVGEEMVVNSATLDGQWDPAVASDAAGNYVVVWESFRDRPANPFSVRGQRYDSNGARLGTEFGVASLVTFGTQPDVAMSADGSFVVVWADYDEESEPRIGGRAYDSTGLPRRPRFYVGNGADRLGQSVSDGDGPVVRGADDYYRGAPSIAAGSDGEFVVVWSAGVQRLQYFGYVSYLTIRGQKIASNGRPTGTPFHVGGFGSYWTIRPDVAATEPGEFVVVWGESSYTYGYEDGFYVRNRSFDVLGKVVTAEGTTMSPTFYVGTDGYRGPAVAADTDGRFVVAWPVYEEGRGWNVFGKRFYGNFAPVGTRIQISNGSSPESEAGRTNAGRFGTDVALTEDGHFIVVWAEGGSSYAGASDGSSTGVFARTFTYRGAPIGGETLVNAYTTSSQSRPAIVAAGGDGLIVAWRSYEQDGSDWGIAARRMTHSPECGDASADGEATATDALATLAAAVGGGICARCVCDVDDSGLITATDALRILKNVVGQPVTLACRAC